MFGPSPWVEIVEVRSEMKLREGMRAGEMEKVGMHDLTKIYPPSPNENVGCPKWLQVYAPFPL